MEQYGVCISPLHHRNEQVRYLEAVEADCSLVEMMVVERPVGYLGSREHHYAGIYSFVHHSRKKRG